jgi:hypothetical protein
VIFRKYLILKARKIMKHKSVQSIKSGNKKPAKKMNIEKELKNKNVSGGAFKLSVPSHVRL